MENRISSFHNLGDSICSDTHQSVEACFMESSAFCDETWKVEKILACIDKGDGRYYKVKWSRCIWQSENSLQPLQQLLHAYWQEQSGKLAETVNATFEESNITSVDQNSDTSLFNLDTQAVLQESGQQESEQVQCHEKENDHDKQANKNKNEGILLPSTINPVTLSNASSHVELPNQMQVSTESINYDQAFSMSSSKEKKFKCESCNKSFDRKTSLQRHLLIHSGEKPWHCVQCGKSFNQNSILQRHLLVHAEHKTFQCDLCGKTFVEKGALKRHHATHTSEKPWVCDICEKSFILKEYLTKHMFLHSGAKPFVCTTCDRAFADSSALKRHQLVHESLKKFTCAVCHSQFKSFTSLKKHQLNCEKLSCVVCKEEFSKTNALLEHVKIHATPFCCSLCTIEVGTYEELAAHEAVHTKKAIYCTICLEKEFESYDCLNDHMAKVHSNCEQPVEYEMFEHPPVASNEVMDRKMEKVPNSFDELFKSALMP